MKDKLKGIPIGGRFLAFLAACIMVFTMVSCSEEKKELGPNEYDVVVIGSGGGGLSAAAMLAKNGMKVIVIEQHYQVGGYMSSFSRKGYTFEASLDAMDKTGIDMFEKLGIQDKVTVVKLDDPYLALFPDLKFQVPADSDEYLKKLQETFPHEAEGIEDLFDTLGSMNTTMGNLMNLQDGKDTISSLFNLIFKPWNIWPVVKYWSSNCTNMMDDFVKDKKFIALFTQLMCYTGIDSDNVSGMLFAMMWNSYHFGGFYYFHGGSHAVTKALAEVVEENGGKVLLSNLVTKIIIKDGRAVGVRAEEVNSKKVKEFKCRYVVSNANAPQTFFKLVGREYLPEDYTKSLENMTIGLPTYAVYLGVNHDYSKEMPNHTIFDNPCFDQNKIFEYYHKGNAEKALYGLINYTMKDPTNAPKGKNVIALISIMPYDYKGDWNRSKGYDAYKALKEKVADTFITRAEKHLPTIRKYVEVMEVATPFTNERYTLNPKGTIFGWEYSIDQSMMKRLPQETPIENLYLSGAWTFPGGGQSAVLISGAMCANTILSAE